MKTIKKDLILKKDTVFNESIEVHGNIKGGYNLKVKGDIYCYNIDCHDIDCYNLDCYNLDCYDIDCHDIDCDNIDCYNLDCDKLIFYASAMAYKSFKCKSWKARRKNYIIKCLNGEIEIKDGK